MPKKTYLTIKGFLRSGMNFTTEVKEWDFVFSHYQSNSWSAVTRISQPLIVKRRADKYSINFSRLTFYPETFTEAALTIDVTGNSGALLRRVIYDFSDFEIARYTKRGTYEEIYFDFHEASVFEASIQWMTSQ